MPVLAIGHEWAVRVAVDSLRRGRVAQAQLIVAPPDAGAAGVAEAIAMAQFCERPDAEGQPCAGCAGCLAVRRRTHPDLHWTGTEGPLGIDEARALVAATQRRPGVGSVSVFVLEACERLTAPAAAALLKTLEDPPGPALFLFLTGSPERLESTLRSRCLPLRLRPMDPRALAAWLRVERPEVTVEAAEAVSRRAGGWAVRALEMVARGPETAEEAATVAPLISGLLAQSIGEAVAASVALAAAGAGPDLALAAVRDALVGHCGLAGELSPASGLSRARIDSLGQACPARGWAAAIPECLRAIEAAEANVNGVLNWNILFIRLQRIRRACYDF